MTKPYLTLVGSKDTQDREFIPLPFYPWEERPDTVPLELEECETAIHLAQGHLPKAAELLKTALYKLNRMIVRHPRLQHIYTEAAQNLAHRAAGEIIDALDSPNDRRREWAATKILSIKAVADHPFAPAPPQPTTQSIALTQDNRTITFRFRTDEDPDPSAA